MVYGSKSTVHAHYIDAGKLAEVKARCAAPRY